MQMTIPRLVANATLIGMDLCAKMNALVCTLVPKVATMGRLARAIALVWPTTRGTIANLAMLTITATLVLSTVATSATDGLLVLVVVIVERRVTAVAIHSISVAIAASGAVATALQTNMVIACVILHGRVINVLMVQTLP